MTESNSNNIRQNVAEIAKSLVDCFVSEDGLDVDSLMRSAIEKRIAQTLSTYEDVVRKSCVDALKNCENVNDLCGDTDLVWVDLDEAVKACE